MSESEEKPVRRKRKKRKHYQTGVHLSPKAGECKYRSGWELKYMVWLDADPNVVSYLYEGVIVPYVSNVRTNKIRKYFPDFLVNRKDGSKTLIEIKPSKRVGQDKVQKKLKAAQVWCVENNVAFQVVTEIELKALGLL